MTKSKLTLAVENQAGQLDPAQSLFVLAEYRQWQWNDTRIRNIEERLLMDSKAQTPMKASARKALIDERHKLVSENTSMWSHIMRHLKDTGKEDVDDFDMFMRGQSEDENK